MQAEHLKQPELIYEISLFGVEVPTKVDDLRKTFRGLMAQKQAERSFQEVNDYTYDDDLKEIMVTLTELKTEIDNFSGIKSDSAYKRISSRLLHINGRVCRLNVKESSEIKKQKSLKTQVLNLEAELDGKVPQPIGASSPINNAFNTNVIPCQNNDIHKWNVSFDGTGSLHDFLSQIELLRVSRGVSDAELFLKCFELFKGSALVWYLSIKSKVTSWAELVAKLKDDFLPCNYQFNLELEINNKTQGVNEPANLFIASMENLFSRLEVVPDEQTRVTKIRRNLLPFYVSQLALHTPKTIDELSNLCKRIEESQLWSERHKSPTTVNNCYLRVSEPRINYNSYGNDNNFPKNPNFSNSHNFSNNHNFSRNLSSNFNSQKSPVYDTRNDVSNVFCWNCNRQGHVYNVCRSPKNIFCYGCGKKNIVKSKCFHCSKNSPRTGQEKLAPVTSQATKNMPENHSKNKNSNNHKNKH